MPARLWLLSAAGVGIVGASVAGGYYFGHVTPAPAPPPQQAAQPTTTPPPSSSDAQAPAAPASANYPAGYEASDYRAWPNEHARQATHRRVHVDFRYFRDSLSPYGRWSHDDRWGEVWQPMEVGADFRPYENGHWVNTDEFGWTWVSNDEWGDIAFHYGRWVDDPDRGWLWVPGYVWGPGWVVWRSGEGHTGWMPMPPDRQFLNRDEGYRANWSGARNDDYGYRQWYGDRYDENRLDSQWIYVDTGHMADRDYRRWEVRRPEEVRQLNQQTDNVTNYTTVNNFVVNRSIDLREVEQHAGHAVATVPASTVIAKPQLVAPVDAGKQVAVENRQANPAGTGRPNSAPPPAPATFQSSGPAAQTGAPPGGTATSTSLVPLNKPAPPVNSALPSSAAQNRSPQGSGASAQSAGNANTNIVGSGANPSANNVSSAMPEFGRHDHRPVWPGTENASAPPAAGNSTPQNASTISVPDKVSEGKPSDRGERQRFHEGSPPGAANSAPQSANATSVPDKVSQGQASDRGERHRFREGLPPGPNPTGAPASGNRAASNPPSPVAPVNTAVQSQTATQPTQPSSNGSNTAAAAPNVRDVIEQHRHRAHDQNPDAVPAQAATPNAAPPASSGQASEQGFRPRGGQGEGTAPPRAVVPTSLPPGSASPFGQTPQNPSAGTQDNASAAAKEDKHHKHHGPDDASPADKPQ